MPAKSKTDFQKSILTVLQTRTQKQAAKYLGVSERTVRRWKNSELKTAPRKTNQKILSKKAHITRTSLVRKSHKAGLPVPPPEKRIKDTDYANVKKLRAEDRLAYLRYCRDNNLAVRFLTHVPKSADYKRGVKSSNWFDLADYTDEELIDLLAEQPGLDTIASTAL